MPWQRSGLGESGWARTQHFRPKSRGGSCLNGWKARLSKRLQMASSLTAFIQLAAELVVCPGFS